MFPERQRPYRLSNQNCCYSDDAIAEIDAKEIAAVTWNDFEAIFALSGCTAEYDEQVYYLPLALRYLLEHPGDGSEFAAGLTYFIASHQDRLAPDGFLEPSLAQLRACLEEWTATFQVVHFDAAACAAKGWRRDHSDYVENSWALRELVDVLLRYELGQLAEEWVESLIGMRRSPQASAWLLEYAREERTSYEYYSRGDRVPRHIDMTPSKRSPRIFNTLMSNLLLQTAYDEIKDTIVASERSPTYWPDLVGSLGLSA